MSECRNSDSLDGHRGGDRDRDCDCGGGCGGGVWMGCQPGGGPSSSSPTTCCVLISSICIIAILSPKLCRPPLMAADSEVVKFRLGISP
ncbi:uncharacterized protein DS421_3g94600 [Arachis hypogaea]|nr:uncharacterized protein DS421_3g94600 [Arachis hypogaea]